jgi:lipopolysaccharide transport system permease protein
MTTLDQTPLDIVVIRPKRGLAPLDLKLLWQFRDLLIAFAERDVRLRYRQTVLGATWVILQPLMGASIFSIVFGMIAKIPNQGAPYFATLSRITPSLLANATLIRRVFFPRLLVPLGVVPSVVLDFLVSLVVMVVLLVIYRLTPGWGLLLVPVCIVMLLAIAIGVGLVAASLAVKYRDIQHLVPFATQLLMYASPVGYSVAAVPAKLKTYYFLCNPIAAPIDTMRWALLGVGQPHFGFLAYSGAMSLLFLLIGMFVFRGAEREFADVI